MDEAERDALIRTGEVLSAKLAAFEELIKERDRAEFSAGWWAARLADGVLCGLEPTENDKRGYLAARDQLDQINKQMTDFWRDHHAGQ